jgi:hypothetical protein
MPAFGSTPAPGSTPAFGSASAPIPPPAPEPPAVELLPSTAPWPQPLAGFPEAPVRAAARPRPGLALLLFGLTVFTTTTLGPVFYMAARPDVDVPEGLGLLLSPALIAWVWRNPAVLRLGLAFALPALFILLVHELGHYLACRRYRLPSTLPYFLPVPFSFGTFGAFIRIQAPIRSKRELFDVGIAGPLAGFAALLPFLVLGIARSQPVPLRIAAGTELLVPGRSLLFELVSRLIHGRLPDGMVLGLHPYALAACFGLLATAINLIPLGQLDGGHILYAVFGQQQRRLARPVWVLLALAGFLWFGWVVWAVLVLFIGLAHPPVVDETTPLDPRRRRLALAALVILVLSFPPRGIYSLEGPVAAPPHTPAAPGATWVAR